MSVGYLSQFLAQHLGTVGIDVFSDQAPPEHRGACVIFQTVGSEPEHQGGEPGTLWRYMAQIDVYAETRADRALYARQVRNLLSGFRGDVVIANTDPAATVKVKSTLVIDYSEDIETGTDPHLYRAMQTASIWIDETAS